MIDTNITRFCQVVSEINSYSQGPKVWDYKLEELHVEFQELLPLVYPQPKPVIVVTLPSQTAYADASNARHVLVDLLGEDYYVVVVHLREGSETSTFKILSVKDIDEIKYEELKQIIESNTKNLSSNEEKS